MLAGKVTHTTHLRWGTFSAAQYFLERILRYTFNSTTARWEKPGREEYAEIVCENGIPF